MKTQTKICSAWSIEALNGFESQLSLNCSDNTKASYVARSIELLQWLERACNIKSASRVSSSVINKFLSKKLGDGVSVNTLSTYYFSFKKFFSYCRKYGHVKKDVMEEVTAPKYVLGEPYVPTVDEVHVLLHNVRDYTICGQRNVAMLELLYSSAIRASELCNLMLADFSRESICVRMGKGGKTRTVPITDSAYEAVRDYIEHTRAHKSDYLFTNAKGYKLDRMYLSKLVKSLASNAGLPYITVHTLRHACATHLLDRGADLRLIQEILGHSSITSTQRYTQVSAQRMQEGFKQFHPRKTNA